MPALHFAKALTPEGWRDNVRLILREGRIVSREDGVQPNEDDERLARGAPAIGNLHSHAFQRAMAGLAETRGDESDSFWTWRETMYRFALKMSPDDVEATAAQAYVEMLESGFAAVAEFHYLHHAPDGSHYARRAEMAERIAAAADSVGIGLTLLPVFYAHSTFGGAAPRPEQRRFVNDLDAFQRLVEDCRTLMRARRRRRRRRAAFVARGDPGRARRASPRWRTKGRSTSTSPSRSRRSRTASPLPARGRCAGCSTIWMSIIQWCCVHATHMDETEARDLARAQAVAGLCPVTEANLGDGVFRAAPFLAAGGRFGVGTDSNVEIGVAKELRQLEYSQRLATLTRNALAAAGRSIRARAVEAAAAGGAQALQRDAGRLAEGAIADIVSFDMRSPHLAGRDGDQILDAWIFSAGDRVDRLRVERRAQGRRGRAPLCAREGRGAFRRHGARARERRKRVIVTKVDLPSVPHRRESRDVTALSLHSQIRADIEQRILSGEWPPGHRIPYRARTDREIRLRAHDRQQGADRARQGGADRAPAQGRKLCHAAA